MASKTIKQDGVIQNQFITRKKKYILDVLPVSSKKSKRSLINFKILIPKSYKVFPYLQPESTSNGYCNTSKNGLNRQCIQPE